MNVDSNLLNEILLENSSKTKLIGEAQKVKLSIIIFIWSALLFFVNLLFHFSQEFSIIFFWLSTLLMVGIVIYQIFFLKNNTFVLFEIFIIYLFLHLVYQIGYYGLRGSDSYVDYNLFKTILYTNHLNITQGVNGWPMIHLLSSGFSIITKIDPLLVAKYIPSFITSIIVLPIYLLSYAIYKDKKIALLSCLFFGFIPQFMNFDALFVRETFGIFIMILFVYIVYVAKRKNDIRYIGLLLILIPILVFSHHFTGLVLLIFLGGYFVFSLGVPYFYRILFKKKIEFSGLIDIKIITLIVFISIITYWFYIKGGDWANAFILGNIENIINPSSNSSAYSQGVGIGTPIVTLKGNIIYYGFLFFHFLFSLILLIYLIIKKNIEKIEDISFSAVFYFCLGYGYLVLYTINSNINPDRLLSFGWICGTIPLIGLFINIRKKILKKIFFVICISFIVFNLYNIDTNYITGNTASMSNITTEKEYLIAKKINFPPNYYGYPSVVAVIYDVQGIPQSAGKSSDNIQDFRHSSTLAVINDLPLLNSLENLKIKSKEQYDKINEILSYKNTKDIDKIYDLGNIYVLRGGG